MHKINKKVYLTLGFSILVFKTKIKWLTLVIITIKLKSKY